MLATKTPEPVIEPGLTAIEAGQPTAAQRCIMAALDHSLPHHGAVLGDLEMEVRVFELLKHQRHTAAASRYRLTDTTTSSRT